MLFKGTLSFMACWTVFLFMQLYIQRGYEELATQIGISAHILELLEMGILSETMLSMHSEIPWTSAQAESPGETLGRRSEYFPLASFICPLGDRSSERMLDKDSFTMDSCLSVAVSCHVYLEQNDK